jgi:hypothetical protein
VNFKDLENKIENTKILCVFSSAVDANYSLDGKESLQDLFAHAAIYLKISTEELLDKAYKEYTKYYPPQDRTGILTVAEVFAEIIYGYEHPRANLKPVVKPKSEAENWFRAFHYDLRNNNRINYTGGGASLNIADAIAGLGITAQVFWLFHSNYLAESSLACSNGNNISRCFFDDDWNWKQCEFFKPGGVGDETKYSHPTRMSLIFTFSPKSSPIKIPSVGKTFKSKGPGRIIFQIQDYRSDDFFSSKDQSYETYKNYPRFGRWHWTGKIDFQEATPNDMSDIRNTQYNRLILSAIQYEKRKETEKLAIQCKNLKLHHEISGSFNSPLVVSEYCHTLHTLYQSAIERTAGMNAEELTTFTSWKGTEVFDAAPPLGKDSLIQSYFRALKVREVFKLNWLYIHGNDIDITVTSSDYSEENHKNLRNAMLFAKIAVFAALHLRSDLKHVPDTFEPSCSPKGFLALYQFARDFANQFGHSYAPGRDALQKKIIQEGYICKNDIIPNVIVVPVYWPDPLEGCSMTGAGDITSGIVAALAP